MTEKTYSTVDQLGPFDVLCGRDKKCTNNVGNRRFRAMITENLPRYLNCESKFERSKAIGAIAKELQENPQGSIRFFKRVKGADCTDDKAKIELLDEKQTREKVAHALRDYAAQHRNNQAKLKAMEENTANVTGSNDSTPAPANQCGNRIVPGMPNLMEEAANIRAQIEALEMAEKQMQGQGGYNNGMIRQISNQSGNHYGHQQQLHQTSNNHSGNHYQHHQQPQQQRRSQLEGFNASQEFEDSENYDDFDVADFNNFMAPLNSGNNHLSAPVGAMGFNHGQQHHQQQYQQQQQQSQNAILEAHKLMQHFQQQTLDEKSEGHDNFNPRTGQFESKTSISHLDVFGSSESMPSVGELEGSSFRKMDMSDITEQKSQGSLRSQMSKNSKASLRYTDVFSKNTSSRAMGDMQDSSLKKLELSDLTFGQQSQGSSLQHSAKSPSNRTLGSNLGSARRMPKAEQSLRTMNVFERGTSHRSVRNHDSMDMLMMKSMETLSIKDGPMQESEVFPLGESVANFDESAKLDMNTSMQQSKLDLSLAHMSIQTIDSDDSILKAQKQS